MSEYCNNCFCCGYYLVPRYKRLVNNIFPQNPQHGLDKNNLERLRFYAVRKPEKLDKPFRYMSEKIARYLRHRNREYVILGIKAMNDTMKSCYQQLNTFVDYYLQTIRLVLEVIDDLELTEHAIASFESFCEIREEAPNYQRNYVFFVDRFTQLCHYDGINQTEFRCFGLRGHRAFIQKTANDELQNDFWKYMEQIVPSLIFNMEVREQDQSTSPTIVSPEDVVMEEDPSALAVTILKDLFCRAHLNNISGCVEPALTHLNNHKKWIPVDFPRYIFSEIMNSIKHFNSYVIIDLLLNHLEKNERTNIKTSIMIVIHDCFVFTAANTGVCAMMFAGISSLLKLLKKSFQNETERVKTSSNEQQFQTAVMNGIGDFAERLPDFQMVEVLQCMIISLPTSHEEITADCRNANVKFQLLLLKKIHEITLKKHSRQSSLPNTSEVATTQTTFPHQLFDPLLKMLSTSESEVRFIVLEILQLLVDKRYYADKLKKIRIPRDISQLGLPNVMQTTKLYDMAFMKKFGRSFLSHLYECILMDNNTKDIFYAIYCLICLVTLEANDQNSFVDVIHFCFAIQTAVDEDQRKLSKGNCYCIHALIAAFFNLMSKSYGITEFSQHADEIIHNRELQATYLLPPNAFRSLSKEISPKQIPKECLFDQETVIKGLNAFNYDTSRFNRVIHLDAESDAPGDRSFDETETDDSTSNKTENENQDEDISYQGIHNVINTDESIRAHENENKRLIKEFRTKPFVELKTLVNEKQKQTDKRIEQLLNVRYLPNANSIPNEKSQIPINSLSYPELFTY